jgi:hypothetical protein
VHTPRAAPHPAKPSKNLWQDVSNMVAANVLYPRWVTLFFLKGAKLSDPKRLLRGSGTKVRHIVLDDPEVLDQPSIKALMAEALKGTHSSLVLHQPRHIVVKGRAPKRRARRPAEGPAGHSEEELVAGAT